MANIKDAYQKWIETNVIDEKIKLIIDYYSYKETKGLIYDLLGISESTWERLKRKYPEIKESIKKAKQLHEHLLLASLTIRATNQYVEETQTFIEEVAGKTKKKIVKTKKYIPADVGANKYLLSKLHGEKYNDNIEMIKIARKRQENNTEVWNNDENKNNETE